MGVLGARAMPLYCLPVFLGPPRHNLHRPQRAPSRWGHFFVRLRQAGAAVDLSRATARRQGPGGDADPRRGFRQPSVETAVIVLAGIALLAAFVNGALG